MFQLLSLNEFVCLNENREEEEFILHYFNVVVLVLVLFIFVITKLVSVWLWGSWPSYCATSNLPCWFIPS